MPTPRDHTDETKPMADLKNVLSDTIDGKSGKKNNMDLSTTAENTTDEEFRTGQTSDDQ